MKIKTWIKYEESYLPPRCRKLRYRSCEDYIYVNLKEVESNELQLAFEDNSYSGKGKIYFYKGKLYCKDTMPNINNIDSLKERGIKIETPLDYLVWTYEHCSTFFFSSWDREQYGRKTDREAAVKAARKGIKGYILVDGDLYVQTEEPRYVVITFGLGHNHGGTGLFCEYYYNSNIRKENYFSALQGEQAVAYANKVATARGDTNDVGKFKPFIVCHMPELVKVKPSNQHDTGNDFLNLCEELIQGSENTLEAGLLIMALAAK